MLLQIDTELWFLWQHIAPIGLQLGKRCLHFFSVDFHPNPFILVGNEDMHEISDEFGILLDGMFPSVFR